jgi:hypothetical protein
MIQIHRKRAHHAANTDEDDETPIKKGEQGKRQGQGGCRSGDG